MKKLIFLLLIIFPFQITAKDCGIYTFYDMNNEENFNFYDAFVTVNDNNGTLDYLYLEDNKELNKNVIINNITNNSCPEIISILCSGTNCTDHIYQASYDSSATNSNGYLKPEMVGGDGVNDVNNNGWSKRYDDIETCDDYDVNYIKACGCIPAQIADIVSKVYFALQVVGPVLLLIVGGFDMVSAIFANDEKGINKQQKKLVNKFIAAASVFLVLTFVKFAIGMFVEDTESMFKCLDILLNGYVI